MQIYMTKKQYFYINNKNVHNGKSEIFSFHSRAADNGALSTKHSQQSGNDSPIYEMLI